MAPSVAKECCAWSRPSTPHVVVGCFLCLMLICVSCAGLLGVRAAVGLGEGVAPSAATDMVARVIAPEERSRAIAFIFGGLHVGSLLGLLVAPVLIERFGWQTVRLLAFHSMLPPAVGNAVVFSNVPSFGLPDEASMTGGLRKAASA